MTHDDAMLAADEKARDAALDISRSFIVQAPAGSGKTELLIQRYLKLLAAVAAPEEILAITFTRKAAAEMQIRVLRALQAARDGEEVTAPHEQTTARAAMDALERDRELDWNLLENPKRMRIQTLDSLNASIARTQPLTATGGAAIRLAIDAVAGAATARLAACLAPKGTVVTYGLLSGEPCQVPPHDVVFREITLTGFWLHKWLSEKSTAGERGRSEWNDAGSGIDAGSYMSQ